ASTSMVTLALRLTGLLGGAEPTLEIHTTCAERSALDRQDESSGLYLFGFRRFIDLSGVERVAQRVTQQIESEYRRADGHSRKHGRPRRTTKLIQIAPVCNHRPPARRRRGNSEPEE